VRVPCTPPCWLGATARVRTFIRYLEFEKGILVRFETGGYGYNPP
jgi:hypothetical protein